ncbi:MAG: M23 family metallopeptidase [Ruminococcaceae bacterium]|nr:M23 family metallopeptidase [Oscillospiraceae bacterium]
MRYGLYSGSKCDRFDKSNTSQRMCIAVNEQDSTTDDIIVKNVEQESVLREQRIDLRTWRAQRAAERKKAKRERSVLRKAYLNAKKFVLDAFKKGAGVVSDTAPGNKKSGGSFIDKCAGFAAKAKKYVSEEKNRPAVALGGSVGLVCVVLLIVLLNFSVGFEAVVNGQSVGIVPDRDTCESIINDVNIILAENFGEESKINAEIVTIPRLVSRGSFAPEQDVKNAICALSDKMREMYVIYLEDTQLCAVASAEEAEQVLTDFQNYYTGGDENVTFQTDKPLTIKAEQAPITLLRSAKEAVNVLNGSEKKENDYTVLSGDTLWGIARKFDTSVDEILSLNEGLGENITDGDVIVIKSYVPVVTVTTSQVKEYKQSIGYETQIVETDSMYKGKSEITQKGENGEALVVANIVEQNGKEISREILSQTTIKEPVTQIKKVGTKKPPSGYGTGSFVAPVYGTVTSRYGYRRSGFHKGIDIANSYGTPIRAADNGKVIFAGWDGLFGKIVKIDHQNGYVTYYAHNSSFAVKVGDIVQKGETIAYMGSTGNSTGNHCHFEIYKNGVLKNPDNYI